MDRADLTKSQRWEIADRLAEERLEKINEQCETVKISTHTFYMCYVKRTIDIIVSLAALIVTLPINLVIGIITLFDVGRPIFFKQLRIGKDGKSFELVKFRNMRDIRDANGDLLHASLRVTKFGKFVRKTSLDELLNFWSILKGDMSLIGPRPLVPEYVQRYSARHYQRLSVKPGLECPPRDRKASNHTWQEQFENDIWYVEHVSFVTDCRMLWNLVLFAFDRKATAERSGVSKKGSFMGYSLDGKAINLDEVPQDYIDYYAAHQSRKDATLF
jgi:lipopolysaccharide/colanic/teichoic acid biosynthesis glycosyltransferase